MNELKRIVEDMQSVFAQSCYPPDFLAAYDQMECLASHSGRETFLVRRKDDGQMAVAKCYDRAVFAIQPRPELLKDLHHPGLPRFIEQYQNEQILCVVREYIEGEPLSDYARGKQLSIREIASLCEQLCGILTVLHGHTPPIIHRDIKPENIIVKPDGSLALIDFDISRSYKDHADNDTVFFGTKGYAPPEQYGFGQTDRRADIYALGILLRWLMTGSVRSNPNISMDPRIQRIIDRCTAFAPQQRYTDAAQVRQALARVGRRRPVPVKRLALTAILLLAALCGGFAVGRFTDWLRPLPRIVFSEPLIERAARLNIGKESGTLTGDDLAKVTRLYIYGSEAFSGPDQFYQQRVGEHAEGPIRQLDDLKLLPNLEEIHIVRQGYLDVSAVADLPRLYTVEIMHSRISGIQPIAHVSRLKHAILFDCGLGDVTALENCPWLETLDVGLNGLTDLKQLGRHPSLRSLGFMWLDMKNVDDIAQRLPRLQTIRLQYSNVKDWSGLRALPKLKEVEVLKEQEDTIRTLFEGTDVEIRVTEN